MISVLSLLRFVLWPKTVVYFGVCFMQLGEKYIYSVVGWSVLKLSLAPNHLLVDGVVEFFHIFVGFLSINC